MRNAAGTRSGSSNANTLNRKAAATPSAMRLNMLSRHVVNDRQPRSRKGQPAHSTTGVASTAWSHCDHVTCASGGSPSRAPNASIQWFTSNGSMSLIAMNSRGNASAAATTKRRVMSVSSGLSPAVADGVSGSSAMPQIGQLPGPCCRISGCIGHV